MSLKDKIKKIINVIDDTEINEIEITSFWGAQKIKLTKKVSNYNFSPIQKHTQPMEKETLDIVKEDKPKEFKGSVDEVNDYKKDTNEADQDSNQSINDE